jgi:hypothetical protein
MDGPKRFKKNSSLLLTKIGKWTANTAAALYWGAIGILYHFFGSLGPCIGGPVSYHAMQPCSTLSCLVAYDTL